MTSSAAIIVEGNIITNVENAIRAQKRDINGFAINVKSEQNVQSLQSLMVKNQQPGLMDLYLKTSMVI